uniref:Treble clef zinc finger domain-containing protein n=1 Tax=Magnetococcus massalia (strain MO-1) TaxID=451514 RepID=A0A1S7LIN7_MAGMO|nr:protein of unknown function [Candidatus Magnetococcus massalia]
MGSTKLTDLNRLSNTHPHLVKEWHPTKNGLLTPDDVSYGMPKRVWWQCPHGHEWKREIRLRSFGSACPYCTGLLAGTGSSLADKLPEVAKLWDTKKNRPLTPHDVLPGSTRRVWWRCKHGHSWEAVIRELKKRPFCPFCKGFRPTRKNSFGGCYPEKVELWNHDKNGNLTPYDLLPSSNRKVWWRCKQGHEWESSPNGLGGKKYDCPYCTGFWIPWEKSIACHYPELIKFWHPTKNGKRTPEDTTYKSQKRHWWQCPNKHEWNSSLKRMLHVQCCPICNVVFGHVDSNFIRRKNSIIFKPEPGPEQPEKKTVIQPPSLHTCLICGMQFPSLRWHLMATHHISEDEYRKMHDLPDNYPLSAFQKSP